MTMRTFVEKVASKQQVPFFSMNVTKGTASLGIPEFEYDNFQELLSMFSRTPDEMVTVVTDTYTYVFYCDSINDSKKLEKILHPVLSEMLEKDCSIEKFLTLDNFMVKHADMRAYKVKGNYLELIKKGCDDVKSRKINLKTKEEFQAMKIPDVKIPKLKKKSLTKGNAFLV